jgi:hypothetical protein
VSRTALGPTQPPLRWAAGALSLGVKRSEREADHSPPSIAEVKNAWSYTSTPQYAFMAWCSIKAQGQLYLLLHLMFWDSVIGVGALRIPRLWPVVLSRCGHFSCFVAVLVSTLRSGYKAITLQSTKSSSWNHLLCWPVMSVWCTMGDLVALFDGLCFLYLCKKWVYTSSQHCISR